MVGDSSVPEIEDAIYRHEFALWQRVRRKFRRLISPRSVCFGLEAMVDFDVSLIGSINIGAKVRIMQGCALRGPIRIGYKTFLNREVIIGPNTDIGQFVSVGHRAMIIPDSHMIGDAVCRAGSPTFDRIAIEDGVWIGAGAIILAGVTLGKGCIIGAGSVVTKDVPPNTIYCGSPARLMRQLSPLKEQISP